MAHEPRKKALDFGGSADDVTLRYRVRVSVWLRLPSDTGDNAMGMFTYQMFDVSNNLFEISGLGGGMDSTECYSSYYGPAPQEA